MLSTYYPATACLSLSVTFRYCVKTAKRIVKIISPPDGPVILVFIEQNAFRNFYEVTPRNRRTTAYRDGRVVRCNVKE